MGKFTKRIASQRKRVRMAVTLDRAKAAALSFDAVYAPTDAEVPGTITPGSVPGSARKAHRRFSKSVLVMRSPLRCEGAFSR